MTKIKRFEDLLSWQKARQTANFIYDLTEHPKFSKDFRLSGQIQDAAGSVMHITLPKVLTPERTPSSFVFSNWRGAPQAKYNPSCTWLSTASTLPRTN